MVFTATASMLLFTALIALQILGSTSAVVEELNSGNSVPHVVRARSRLGSVADFAGYGVVLTYTPHTSMRATLNIPAVNALKKPTDPDPAIMPPGWAALGASLIPPTPQLPQRRQRCHMLPALLGGTNVESQNFFSCHWKTNNPAMKHFESLADYILRSSNAHYEPLAGVAAGSSSMEYLVSTVTNPGSSYPDVVKIQVVQIIGAFTRVAFDVWIENKPDFTGKIVHQCKPWFDETSGKKAMGPPSFRSRALVEEVPFALTCAHNQPAGGTLWVQNT